MIRDIPVVYEGNQIGWAYINPENDRGYPFSFDIRDDAKAQLGLNLYAMTIELRRNNGIVYEAELQENEEETNKKEGA